MDLRPIASLPDGPVPIGPNLVDDPLNVAALTAMTTPARKGVPPAGSGSDATPPTDFVAPTDMAQAGAAASLTPPGPAGPIVPPSAPTGHGPQAVPVAHQILPSVIALAQGQVATDRISISLSPDQLGHVSITVERASDGTTSIQISAERLATLDLLRTDQADLQQALHQAGVAQTDHSLSFSWQGGNGGTQGWAGQDQPQGERRPASAQLYVEGTTALAGVKSAAALGRVDVTA